MSEYLREIERLQRLVEKERREKEEAKARENEAKAQVEKERREKEEAKARENEAKAQAEKERREKEKEQHKNRKTTLDEYLRNSHFYLYKNLTLADISQSSTGHATRVDGKYYPKWLRPWNRFTNRHRQQHFEDIKIVCGKKRLFDQESTTRAIGRTIARNQAGNEIAIDYFEKVSVENAVGDILECVWKEESRREKYQCKRLRFDNNIRSLMQSSDVSQVGNMVQSYERQRRTGTSKRTASKSAVKRPPLKPDGYGIRTHLDEVESFAFVYDYKAAHKFAVGYLQAAVAKETLFMEVIELANKGKYKNDDELQEKEREEARIAMALTQVFYYMVRCGVAYGYVAAGKCLVLLHIDRADLQTLYYHLCVPDEEVTAETSAEGWASQASHTAVAQLASFCLLSLRSEALKGEALDAALLEAEKELKEWGTPYDDAAQLHGGDGADSSSTTSSSGSDGSDFKLEASPATRKYPLRSRSSCKTAEVLGGEDDEEDEDGGGRDLSQIRTRNKEGARKQGHSSGSRQDKDTGTRDSAPTRQYCTQACLLGLKRGLDLDKQCPNVLSHRATEGDTRHPIDASEFTRLVGERLRQNPYRHCEALDGRGKVGAIGVLFKLELPPYGYTFVGKGTLSDLRRRLEHESYVYAQLDKLQGEVVPVYLGIVHLSRGYVFPGGDRVFDMMLMSWGGEGAPDARTPGMMAEVQRSSRAVRAEGVYHGDERGPNRLWNEERRRVMLIDFDRATVLPASKHKQPIEASNTGKRQSGLAKHTRKRGSLLVSQ